MCLESKITEVKIDSGFGYKVYYIRNENEYHYLYGNYRLNEVHATDTTQNLPLDSGDGCYKNGFHIFLSEEEARKYIKENHQTPLHTYRVVKVAFKNGHTLGIQKGWTNSYQVLVAEQIKLLEDLS